MDSNVNMPPAQSAPAPAVSNPVPGGDDMTKRKSKKYQNIAIVSILIIIIAGLLFGIFSLGRKKNFPKLDPKVTCAKFTDLDYALQNIKAACTLDLSNQNLSSLPQNVAKLTNLTQIILNKNKFSTIPKELTSLSKLYEIDIANNKIDKIPDYMGEFKNLQALDLSGNSVTENKTEMEKLTTIKFVVGRK